MTRTKLGLSILCTVVIGLQLTSVGFAQGSTLSWLILNSAGTTATELKAGLVGEKDSEHLTLDLELAGLKVAVTCTEFTLNGVNLETGGKLTEGGKTTFKGCKVFKTAPLAEEYKCTVKTGTSAAGTIETNEFKGELVSVGTKLLIKVEPLAGPTGNFATLKFEGAECVLPTPVQIHGTIFLEDCESLATTHAVKHLFQAEPISTALYMGAHSTKQLEVDKLLGSIWIKLAGVHTGLKWAAMSDQTGLEWSGMDAESKLSWLILNASHTTATELKELLVGKPDSTHLTLDGELTGLKVAITCTDFEFKGLNLETGGKLTEGGKTTFKGCKVFKTAPLTEEYKCTVKTGTSSAGTIETNEFKGELVLVEGEVQTRIEPKAGPTGSFATLKFEGAECVLPTPVQVHGTLYLKDAEGFATTHRLEHLVESSKATLLYLGGHSAKQLEVTKVLGGIWVHLS